MAITAIPRTLDGALRYPGAYSKKYTADFTTLTALPSWLTVGTSEGTATIVNGELSLQATKATWPGTPAHAFVAGPSIDLAQVSAVRITVDGQYMNVNPGSSEAVQALSTWSEITASTGKVGVMLHKPSTSPMPYLRHTTGDWPVTSIPQYAMDEIFIKSTARANRTLSFIPATKMAYGIENKDEVRLAREMTASTLPVVTPLMGVKLSGVGTFDYRFRFLEIEVFYP